MYLPWRGSTLTSMDAGSNAELVISATDSCSWYAFSAEMMGANEETTKWMRGYGTRLVWNSVTSTLRLRRQMSYRASLSTMKETSVCSRSECVDSTQLYGSTTAVDTWGDG